MAVEQKYRTSFEAFSSAADEYNDYYVLLLFLSSWTRGVRRARMHSWLVCSRAYGGVCAVTCKNGIAKT